MALQSFQDKWSQASGAAHEFNHVFGCEVVLDKRVLGMTVIDHAGHSDSCMFVDVSDLEGVCLHGATATSRCVESRMQRAWLLA